MTALFSEFLRHVLVHLVFQKPSDELISGILFFSLLVFLSGKEHTALDVQQRRSHDQKLTGHIHVVAVHLSDIFQILIRDRHDRNVINIYFILLDQVHEKVHRPLKDLKL